MSEKDLILEIKNALMSSRKDYEAFRSKFIINHGEDKFCRLQHIAFKEIKNG